jgi:putrescine---pyruvate transaminase
MNSITKANHLESPSSTSDVQQLDSAHYYHPFTDHASLAKKGARVITKAEGIYIWDSEGKQIFDGMSGLWCVNVGYGRQELINAATEQMQTLPYYNSFFQTTNVPAVKLANLIIDVAPKQPDNPFTHVFFAGSGSEGNDTGVRAIRRYWDLMGQHQRKTIIGRWNGYHGSTVAGASLGGMKGMHEHGDLPIPGVVHIDQPYHAEYEATHGPIDVEAFGLKAAQWLEEKILEIGPDKVAAFIGEPVQGAGGVIIPPKSYWPEIQRICHKYGVLIWADEVICGFGRLGRWFGCEVMGFSPDLITFAKGVTSGYIPLGGSLMSKRITDVLIGQGGEFNHGYTYSGHPVACAVGFANVNYMREHGLVEHVAKDIGPYLAAGFETLKDHPIVGHAQTCGLVGGLLLVQEKGISGKTPNKMFNGDWEVGMMCRAHCFANGLIMRAVGDRMIIAPPLVCTKKDIDELMRLIRLCLDKTLAELREKGMFAAA